MSKKKYKTKVKTPDFQEPVTMLGCGLFVDMGMDGVPAFMNAVICENVRFIRDVEIQAGFGGGGYYEGCAIAIIEDGKLIPIDCQYNLFTRTNNPYWANYVEQVYKDAIEHNHIVKF